MSEKTLPVKHQTEADAIRDLAADFFNAVQKPLVIKGSEAKPGTSSPHLVLPDGYHVEDLEKLLPQPLMKRGHPDLTEPASLADYVNKHKTEGTAIFADAAEAAFAALIDGHAADGPGWGRHRATLQLTPTEPWKTWTSMDGKPMSQEAFGLFLDENMAEIARPAGADLFEICTNLRATLGASFHQAVKLVSGEMQFTYAEAIEESGGRADKGHLRLPERFTLVLAPYEGTDAREVVARLRYRIKRETGELSFHYKLHRPDEVARGAFDEVRVQIAEETGVAVYAGAWHA